MSDRKDGTFDGEHDIFDDKIPTSVPPHPTLHTMFQMQGDSEEAADTDTTKTKEEIAVLEHLLSRIRQDKLHQERKRDVHGLRSLVPEIPPHTLHRDTSKEEQYITLKIEKLKDTLSAAAVAKRAGAQVQRITKKREAPPYEAHAAARARQRESMRSKRLKGIMPPRAKKSGAGTSSLKPGVRQWAMRH